MTISELESKVSLIDLVQKDFKLKKVGNETFRISTCPICGSKDHFTVKANENYYSSFNGCCSGGSVYKYLQEVKGIDSGQAYKELEILADFQPDNKKSAVTLIPLAP